MQHQAPQWGETETARVSADALAPLLGQCPIGAAIVGPDLSVRYANTHFAAMMALGADRAAWPAFDTLVADRGLGAEIAEAIREQRDLERREIGLKGADQRPIWALVSAEPVRFAGAAATLVWLDDVTHRHLALEALRTSEERLELAVAGTRSAIWEVDYSRRTTWWSQEFYRMLGYREGQHPAEDGNVWERHIHPEDAARISRGIQQYLEAREAGEADDAVVYEATYRMCRVDGSVIWVVAKGRRSLDEMGRRRRFNGIMFDITAEKRAEQALRQAQQDLIQAEKMAALGSLVAGVAHEINTPLGNTLTAASHLHDKVNDFTTLLAENRLRRSDLIAFSSLLNETTRLMVANCERAAELVQSFKQVAVDQTSGERRRFDLREYINEVLVSLRPRLRKTRHRITVDCPENLEIDGYPGVLVAASDQLPAQLAVARLRAGRRRVDHHPGAPARERTGGTHLYRRR